MSNNQPQPAKKTNNPFDIFIIGARKGLNITLNNLVPNILMAYAVAEVLRILGVMKMVGEIFGPLMFVFGLPGEAVTVVLTAWLSSSASVGLAANMAAKFAHLGSLSGESVTNPAEAQRLIDQLFACENAEYTSTGRRIMSLIPIEEIDKKF